MIHSMDSGQHVDFTGQSEVNGPVDTYTGYSGHGIQHDSQIGDTEPSDAGNECKEVDNNHNTEQDKYDGHRTMNESQIENIEELIADGMIASEVFETETVVVDSDVKSVYSQGFLNNIICTILREGFNFYQVSIFCADLVLVCIIRQYWGGQ